VTADRTSLERIKLPTAQNQNLAEHLVGADDQAFLVVEPRLIAYVASSALFGRLILRTYANDDQP
jgi:hypothetical protein